MKKSKKMKLNNKLIELARINLDRSDREKLQSISGLDKMSSVYAVLQGKRKVNQFQYDVFQKYILAKSSINV